MADIEKNSKTDRAAKKKSGKAKTGKAATGASKKNSDKTSAIAASDAAAGGSSWRDFISNASAALDDFEETAPNVTSPDDSAMQEPEGETSSVNVGWNAEARNLEMIEDPAASAEDVDPLATSSDSSANPFEELARRVAQSVSERSDLFEDPPANPDENGTLAEELSTLSDDSGQIHDEPIDAAKIGEEPEISFDIDNGEQVELSTTAQTEGDLFEEGNADVELEASIDGELEASIEGELEVSLEPQATFEDSAEVLNLDVASETTNTENSEDGENSATGEPTEFIDQDTLVSVIESLLFSTDKPVSITTIKQIFKGSNIRSKDILAALDTLASHLAAPNRGVTLEEVGSGYQLRTKTDNADYLRRLAKVRPFRLSGPALEVMSIVAYKQPVTKHEIDEIRGVESGHLLRALMERGLVAFGGKSELPGKPMNYNTTRKFLETFGLRNLKELPTLSEIDEILPEGIGEVEEKETLSDITDSLSTSIGSSYSEGEDELEKINAQLQQVDTTSDFFEQEKVREREKRDRERAQDIREKLVVGETVETKDRRWLDRYEAKLLEPLNTANNVVDATTGQNPEENTPPTPDFSEQLETLTTEEQIQTAEIKAEEAWADEDSGEDDLIGNEDWNEDGKDGERGH